MRRQLLVNALIFAVLAASVTLAYYGYSYTNDSRDRELRLMHDLAKEKVLNIESLIAEQDTKFLRGVQIEPMSNFDPLVKDSEAAITSLFVLDEDLKPILNGYAVVGHSRNEAQQDEFRVWFMRTILPLLRVERPAVDQRGTFYAFVGERPMLFSFMRRQVNGKTFYVVIEDDLNYFVFTLFPQFFPTATASPRLYEVIDDRRVHVFGPPFLDVDGSLVADAEFHDTMEGWILRVADRDLEGVGLRQRGIVDTLVIALAVTVILASLGFLAIAIGRERKSNELKSEFISNVSHELKTPLSIISMFGEMLALSRTKSPAQAVEYAEIIWRESVRLGRLIDNVLDFAKIERGMGVYEFGEADVGEVVDRAVELSQRRLQAAGMTMDVDIAPELPMARLDANAYTLAILNLIDNAIKYAADGKKIALTVKHDNGAIVLAVRDWGPGIDREEQDKIFERFYRARSVRLKPIRGSGIGLALVQHIARAHRGEVVVDSTPGKGATFTIVLPAE